MVINWKKIHSEFSQFTVRVMIALIGFCTIALFLASDKLLQSFVLYLPFATFAGVLTDFGKVELTSAFGLTNRNFIKAKRLIYIFTTVYALSLLTLNLIPNHHLPKLDNYVLFLSLAFLGLTQVPIDIILRGILFIEKKGWPVYIYQSILSFANITICLLWYVGLINPALTIVSYVLLPSIILKICFQFNLIQFFTNLESSHSHSTNLRLTSVVIKVAPVIIYSLLTFLIEYKLSERFGLAISNRVFFFLNGFLMVRIMGREEVVKNVSYYLVILTIFSFALSFFLQIVNKASFPITINLVTEIVNTTFLSTQYVGMMLFMSIIYAFFIVSYQRFIYRSL